jgi:hypothetical protein
MTFLRHHAKKRRKRNREWRGELFPLGHRKSYRHSVVSLPEHQAFEATDFLSRVAAQTSAILLDRCRDGQSASTPNLESALDELVLPM